MIYFVRSIQTGNIKIGCSSNVKKRIAQLIVEHGELQLLGVIAGGRAFEYALHMVFAEYRIQGLGREWFLDNPSLQKYIGTFAYKPDVLRPEYRRKLHKPVYQKDSVNCHLYELMLKKRQQSGFEDYDIYALASDTGISIGILDRLIRNRARVYMDAHCDTLIKFFRCTVSDLLTYEPNAQPA